MQTEFPFTLPRGYIDTEGNVHRQGMMRLATAMDEAQEPSLALAALPAMREKRHPEKRLVAKAHPSRISCAAKHGEEEPWR